MIRLGNTQPIQLQPSRVWRTGVGWVTIRRWRGHYTELQSFIPFLRAQGIEEINLEPEQDNPLGTLTYTVGNLDDGSEETLQLENLWTRTVNDLELDILEHPKAVAIEAAVPGALAFIKTIATAAIEDPTPGERATVTLTASVTIQTWAQQLLDDLVAGVEKFPFSQPVLRNTRTVSGFYTVALENTNGRTVFSTAKLLELEPTIPAIISTNLESGFWLKRPVTREQMSNGKFQISSEYWFVEAFSPFLYDVVQ